MSKFPITIQGYERLEQEIKNLKYVERPQVIKDIAAAREFGDLSENAEYHAARDKQSFIEGRIIDLEDKMARAEIIDITKLSGPIIKFGATVSLLDDDTEENIAYRIVGEYEANITKKLVSIVSPIARALIGKMKGDFIEVSTPKGIRSYEVLEVKYEIFNL